MPDVNPTVYGLLPDNLRSISEISDSAIAIDSELSELNNLLMAPAIFSRISTLSSQQLDHLAWQLDAKAWRDSWPVSLKRSFIKQVISLKSVNGTRSAVLRALSGLGSAAVIKEWWQQTPKAIPHTFEIEISISNVTDLPDSEFFKDLILTIDQTKSVRSHYILTQAIQAAGQISLTGAVRPVVYNRLQLQEVGA